MSSTQVPIKLNVFDFDGALFKSPRPNPQLWCADFINLLTQEHFLYKNWYQDKRSLDIGEDAILPDWWNSEGLSDVRQSMIEPDSLTILLSGRKYSEFHQVITRMVGKKGLIFDIMGFVPEKDVLDWQLYYNPEIVNKIGLDRYNMLKEYKTKIYVFTNINQFKEQFIGTILLHHPTIESVNVWKDSLSSSSMFKIFLDNKLIDTGRAKRTRFIELPLEKCFLEPFKEWEFVLSLLRDHNGYVNSLPEPASPSPFRISYVAPTRKIQYVGIFFAEDAINTLRLKYPPPKYKSAIEREWSFEGSYIFLSIIPTARLLHERGTIVTLKVIAQCVYENRYYFLKVEKLTVAGLRQDDLFIMLASDKKYGGGFPDPREVNPVWERIPNERQVLVKGIVATKCIMGHLLVKNININLHNTTI
ncbi:19492_t:CDS:1 [Cetraspora pellucida]|uniref:19492_t:CDS:1 n=1 Tax=Cetraspora pellucida TaxID=1433469 RepID=A0A9N9JCC6_9GLOM|nr:19492_t:CDS:1 [Cetraspora pellucida]